MGRTSSTLLLMVASSATLTGAELPSSSALLPYRFEARWQRGFRFVSPVDTDGDSADEFLVLLGSRGVQLFDVGLQATSRSFFQPEGTFGQSSHCGGSDGENLWVSYRRNDTLLLCALWAGREIPLATGQDLNEDGVWEGYTYQVELADLEGDGGTEVVASVEVGFDLRPRGVFVLDWETGTPMWQFQTGPTVPQFLVFDLNGDGRREIVCATYALGNGNSANGLHDWLSYAFALDYRGTLLWLDTIGHYSSMVMLDTIRSAPSAELRLLAIEIGNPAGGRKCDRTMLLDPLDGRVLNTVGFGAFNSGACVTRGRGGSGSVVLSGSDDTVRILDSRLGLRRKRYVPACSFKDAAVPLELHPGRNDHTLLGCKDGRLRVFDPELRLLAESEIPGIRWLKPVRGQGNARMLVHAEVGSETAWHLIELQPVPLLQRAVFVADLLQAGGILLAFLVLTFVLVLVLVRYRQARDIRTVISGLAGRAAVVEFNRAGHPSRANRRARDMLGGSHVPDIGSTESLAPARDLVRAAVRDRPGAEPREAIVALGPDQNFMARATRVHSGVILSFEDITDAEYVRKAKSWAPMAQKLAHGIKNPLTTIGLIAQRLQKHCQPEGEQFVESIREDVERLRQMTDGFMRFANLEPPKLEEADINQLVRDSLKKLESVKPEGIAVVLELGEDLPKLQTDREQMATVFDNIIENAVSAMKEHGSLTVRTRSVKEEGKVVEVSILDTGPGIPDRYLAKVFEPYFTRKPGGTGLGMAITKRIVEDHNGTISITSSEGKGTTVTVVLPVVAGTGNA
ncbi:MAG: hypothetical protein JSU73_11315 [candidate division WOR-3 bacterium]|nr:MAG: hypothetical protein JSU73_11315 [candidate division WOR-3 bacterium]